MAGANSAAIEHPQLRAVGRDDRRQAFALLWRAARPDRRQMALASLLLLTAGGLEALGPIFGKRFIDEYLLPGRLELWPVALLIGGIVISGATASALRYFQLVRLAGVAMRSVRRLRESVYNHVLRLPMAFFDKAITGQLVSRITNDTEQIRQLYVQVLFEMLQGLSVLLGAVAAMAWLDWRLMLIVMMLIPATVLIVLGYQRLSSHAVMRARELRSEINAQMGESIAGMSVLQATGAARRFAKRFANTNREHYRSRLGEVRANAWLLRPALDMMSILLIVAIIAAFGTQSFGALEIGLLYAFITYVARVVEPLISITMQFSLLQQALVAASRVNTLLDEGDGSSELQRVAHERRVSRGHVQLSDVTFGYDPQQPILHDVSIDVPAGSFVGIAGHTGSGKSTLLALLLRFYVPQAGRLEIDGIPLATIGDEHFRADVGLVPQEPFLLAASARENIDMGRSLPFAQIEAAARAANAHAFITALEQGYDTPLGEGGARLSSGQKQLIAVARALAGAPRVLFLDEATSRIDSDTERQVADALSLLHGKTTVIAIAHRLSTIRAADRIFVLNHGRLAEQGTHEQLMAIAGGIYQRLYLLQQIVD
ncbi:MAG TPA: ABC transporter transmembrane domain-containing protein [Burkholderiaceae bacterium]|nr:ABC transporter transmembrane domain-containing protein [Burkholderiaceae bacterium]